MIWKHTWPVSRVIEVAICEDEPAEEYTDVAILRFAGSMSLLLEEDFGTRVVEGKPLETSGSSCSPSGLLGIADTYVDPVSNHGAYKVQTGLVLLQSSSRYTVVEFRLHRRA
jgi:hypothetical protein